MSGLARETRQLALDELYRLPQAGHSFAIFTTRLCMAATWIEQVAANRAIKG